MLHRIQVPTDSKGNMDFWKFLKGWLLLVLAIGGIMLLIAGVFAILGK